ncbi:hypothetical protein [Syntrophorhabdus aromaticivorans]|jgi:hypothetical protein|uniref:Uncharacterized protein n=1 Tax=Syntrophorhabdus aromaticivorans TaxID=328301 RepID=A0A971M4W9_9BACT|nr:hypothetical protein [Syntrophorhabdus aromaticivorans]NLW35156.1 hypothetical protein [Syntrophorhabdus aromaticivorans]
MRKVRIEADEGMSACVRHCDRSGNGIHTVLLRSMVPPALEKRLEVDRM